jgi:hypothetical protein
MKKALFPLMAAHSAVAVGNRGSEKEDGSAEVFSIRGKARAHPKAQQTGLNSARSKNMLLRIGYNAFSRPGWYPNISSLQLGSLPEP